MDAKQIISKKQAAEILGISVRTLEGLVRDRLLHVSRIGRAVRINRADVLALVPAGGAKNDDAADSGPTPTGYLTLAEVQAELRVSERKVASLLSPSATRRLKSVKVGTRRLVARKDLDAYIAANMTDAKNDDTTKGDA